MYDLILKNASIADTVNEIFTAPTDIAIKNGKIAKIGALKADAKNVIDCSGMTVSAGLIDAHVHIESSMVTPKEFGRIVLPHGTTTVIADPHEIVNVGGAKALNIFMKMAEAAPIDIFTVLPSSVPATPFDTNGAGYFTAADMKPFADNPRVAGLGEVMCFNQVLANSKSITDKIELFKNKTVDGHTAGLDSKYVEAYASAGIQNDHECTSFEEAKIRIDNGMNVYIREGSAAHNLTDIVSGIIAFNKNAETNKENAINLDKFAFCTDDKHLGTIEREGHIDRCVRMAVECGMAEIDAIKLATLNPSLFYKLTDRGVVETDKIADLVVYNNKTELKVLYVIKNGKIAQGSLTDFSKEKENYLINSVKYKSFSPADFTLEKKSLYDAIELVNNQLITNKVSVPADKIENMLATIERHGKNGNFALCPIVGYGIKQGAVATSVSHDSHNVVVAGDNAGDMAVAVNRLREIGGGYVVAHNGKVAGELQLDIAGLMSSKNAKEVEVKITELEKLVHGLGVNKNIDPFITLSFVALPVIPFVRLLDTGLFEVLTQKFI